MGQAGRAFSVNVAVKITCQVRRVIAGAGLINGMELLRHGAMPRPFDGHRPRSTLGSFTPAITHGTVAQLASAGRDLLAPLVSRAGPLTDADNLVVVRGLNGLVATVITPLIAAARLRDGSAASAHRTARLIAEAIATAQTVSVTVSLDATIRKAIESTIEGVLTPIKNLNAIHDEASAQ